MASPRVHAPAIAVCSVANTVVLRRPVWVSEVTMWWNPLFGSRQCSASEVRMSVEPIDASHRLAKIHWRIRYED